MCVIAGYSGNRRAAPILIEMLRKIEYYDGGYATGIATVHEGKIYYATDKIAQAQYISMFEAEGIKVALVEGPLDFQTRA